MMKSFILATESGAEWLVQAVSLVDALRIYYEGEAEPHRSIRQLDRRTRSAKETIEYLTSMGQVS